MFDFAWTEIALIGVVALVAIGPKDMPGAIKAVAAMVKKARRMAGEFQTHVDEMVREANLDEVRTQINQIRSMDVKGMVERAVDGDGSLRTTFAGNPLSTPSTSASTAAASPAAASPAAASSAAASPPAASTTAASTTAATSTPVIAVAEHETRVLDRPDGVDPAPASDHHAAQDAPSFIPPSSPRIAFPAMPEQLGTPAPPAFIPPSVAHKPASEQSA